MAHLRKALGLASTVLHGFNCVARMVWLHLWRPALKPLPAHVLHQWHIFIDLSRHLGLLLPSISSSAALGSHASW